MTDHPTQAKPRPFCPVCHAAALAPAGEALRCPSCGHEFPRVDGVPILINDANSVFAIADYRRRATPSSPIYGGKFDAGTSLRGLYRRATYRLSLLGAGVIAHAGVDEAIAALPSAAGPAQVLIIGSGEIRYAQNAVFTYTDVIATPGIDAVADAHDLPFDDASFDLVVAVAVLEHVADPQRVVAEIWRVLKPDGLVYANTPFLQPVHMAAYDFTRFTYLGHRRLFRWFRDIDSGLSVGPGSAAAGVLRHVALSLSDRPLWQRLANPLAMLALLPLKYLDHLCRRSDNALDAASAVYFLGQKQPAPISDRDMIALYRGGFPKVNRD